MLRTALIPVVVVLATNFARGQLIFGAPSCLGKCTHKQPSFLERLKPGCSCSSFCETNQRPICCQDYWEHCSASCKRRCGKGFHPLYPCQCYEGCTGPSCCTDYKEVCVDGGPRSLTSPTPPTTTRTTTTPKPQPIEIGYSFITGKEVTCPKGVAFVACPFNPCNEACQLFPNAKCEVYQCGTCEARYTDNNNERLDCFNPDNYCANGQKRYNCGNIDLCLGTSCPAFPQALCIPNNCGGCHYDYIDRNGKVVNCEVQTGGDMCQEDCVDDPCQSAICEAHPDAKCVSKKTGLCGVCRASFVQNGVELSDNECDVAFERNLFVSGPSKCSNGNIKVKCGGTSCVSSQCLGHSMSICVEDPCDSCRARFYDIALRELTCQTAGETTTTATTTAAATTTTTSTTTTAATTPTDISQTKVATTTSAAATTTAATTTSTTTTTAATTPTDISQTKVATTTIAAATTTAAAATTAAATTTTTSTTTTAPTTPTDISQTIVATTTTTSAAATTAPDTTAPVNPSPAAISRSMRCPNGNVLQSCDHQAACQSTTCRAYQNAICKANPCDGCKAIFFNDLGERINCDEDLSAGGTCLGRCGRNLEKATCQCTNDCRRKDNCCSDFATVCLPEKTCKGKCGSPYAPSDICQCNKHCIAKSDCCSDYGNECG